MKGASTAESWQSSMDGCDAASSEPHFVAPQQRMRIAKESGAALACELHRRIGYDRSLGKLADAAGCAREGAMKLHAPACPLNLESHLIRVQAITDAPRRPTGNSCWNVAPREEIVMLTSRMLSLAN